jgi:hypothetical protein
MPRLDRLPQINRSNLLTFPAQVNDTAPFATPAKPLAACRLPSAGGDEIARWFWGETASSQLLRRVGQRLEASDDPRWKAAAFGVAR